MTNINCSSNCVYQKEGKCTLEDTDSKVVEPGKQNSKCAYFLEKEE